MEYIPKFGEYVEHNDWVECESRTFPDKYYYFNLRTSCKTWNRPVSRHVRIPRFSYRSINRESSFDTTSLSIAVSTDEEEDDKGVYNYANYRSHERSSTFSLIRGNSNRTKNVTAETLMRFSHYSQGDYELDKKSCNTAISSFTHLRENYEPVPLADKRNDEGCADQGISIGGQSDAEEYQFNIEKFLDVQLFCDENAMVNLTKDTGENKGDSEVSKVSATLLKRGLRNTLEHTLDTKERRTSRNAYEEPRLKKLDFNCLLGKTTKRQVRRRPARKSSKEKERPNVVIREVDGIKTISYDLIRPFPSFVDQSNLSDSSSVSTERSALNRCEENNYGIIEKAVLLSEVSCSSTGSSSRSSSSVSCGSCSRCSCTSST